MNYDKVRFWIMDDSKRYDILSYLYQYLPYGVAMIYALMLGKMVKEGNWQWIRVVIVCAFTFALCTVLRAALNHPRPYEEGREALIDKDTEGKSFPSRHMASVSIIWMSGIYTHFGVATLTICVVVLAFIRWMAGVHYTKDIVAGIVLGVVCGWLGFWMI